MKTKDELLIQKSALEKMGYVGITKAYLAMGK